MALTILEPVTVLPGKRSRIQRVFTAVVPLWPFVVIIGVMMGWSAWSKFAETRLLPVADGNTVRIAVPDNSNAAEQFKRALDSGMTPITCRDEDERHAVIEFIKARRKNEMQK